MAQQEHREKNPNFKDICIDFDGVIHSYRSGWQGAEVIPDPPVHNAIPTLHNYCNHFNVNIYSARSATYYSRMAMMKYINKWDNVWLDSLPEGSDKPIHLRRKLWFPETKPPAMIYIDDRGFRFEGIFPTVEEIERLFYTWTDALDIVVGDMTSHMREGHDA